MDPEIKLIDRAVGPGRTVKIPRVIEIDNKIFWNEARIEKAINISICIENQPASREILELLLD